MDDDTIPRVDLTNTTYTVKQRFFRNKYQVFDEDGNTVLNAKQKLFKMREEFPFTNADGETVFTVKAQNLLDIAGDYAITAPDGEVIAILTKNFTIVNHKWKVKDPDGEVLVTIRSPSTAFNVLRAVSGLADLVPHSYLIETPDGTQVGKIQGKFSLRDTYDITVYGEEVPRETVVAAAIAVDALEGN